MSLSQNLNADLKTAMKAKDQAALRSIRAFKAAILIAQTDGSGNEVTEEIEMKILQKLVKQRKESLDIFEKQGREDLAVTEREEIEVLTKYLPAQMSEDEIRTEIQTLISTTGAEGMKDMGKIMGQASQKFGGAADGKVLAGIVRELLTA